MIDWSPLGMIAENIAYSISVIGLTGIAWLIADTILDRIRNRHSEEKKA